MLSTLSKSLLFFALCQRLATAQDNFISEKLSPDTELLKAGEEFLETASQRNTTSSQDASSKAKLELYHGNHAEKTLDMRPSEHEPEIAEEDIDARFDTFVTEPTFKTPKITIHNITDDRSLLSNGYYFFGPYETGASGPQVFDQNGQLVYWGSAQTHEPRIKNFLPCSYQGSSEKNHLCWSEVFHDLQYGHEYVTSHVLDNTYSRVHEPYGAIEGWHNPNSHEYNMLPSGKSFLQAVYQIFPWDLSPYDGPEEGWVHDGCFQEIDTATGAATFSWCATENMSLDTTYVYLDVPNQQNFTEAIAGNGSYKRSWDFIHLNAVDKLQNGDYIVSARHFNSIFCVAGAASSEPGKVLWSLGGKLNDFQQVSNFTFSRQHHVRVVEEAADGQSLTISLFNNGFNVRNSALLEGLASSGQIIHLDLASKSAGLLHEYTHPDAEAGWRASVTIAEGSMDVLDNGNAVLGWGSLPTLSEFAGNGDLLFHASYAGGHGRSYRVFKREWSGTPSWGIKAVVYKAALKSETAWAYVSWNGATEVTAWRFSLDDEYAAHVGVEVQRDGFETKVDLREMLGDGYAAPFVLVEALDRDGNVLGRVIEAVFVPSQDLIDSEVCGAERCGRGFEYKQQDVVVAESTSSSNEMATTATTTTTGTMTLPTKGATMLPLLLIVAFVAFVEIATGWGRFLTRKVWCRGGEFLRNEKEKAGEMGVGLLPVTRPGLNRSGSSGSAWTLQKEGKGIRI